MPKGKLKLCILLFHVFFSGCLSFTLLPPLGGAERLSIADRLAWHFSSAACCCARSCSERQAARSHRKPTGRLSTRRLRSPEYVMPVVLRARRRGQIRTTQTRVCVTEVGPTRVTVKGGRSTRVKWVTGTAKRSRMRTVKQESDEVEADD